MDILLPELIVIFNSDIGKLLFMYRIREFGQKGNRYVRSTPCLRCESQRTERVSMVATRHD
jgi:hypothetical protein